jgi:GR25 family glycosyltransferase involved in LPS biosynthesis
MAYAISPKVAERLIAGSKTLHYPVDHYIRKYWEHKQPLYCLAPAAVTHGDLAHDTTIHDRQWGKKSPTLKARRFIARTIDVVRKFQFNYFVSRP